MTSAHGADRLAEIREEFSCFNSLFQEMAAGSIQGPELNADEVVRTVLSKGTDRKRLRKGPERALAIRLLRALAEEYDLGDFVVGRHSRDSRLKFKAEPKDVARVGKALLGKIDLPPTRTPPAAQTAGSAVPMTTYPFRLRADLTLNLSLPNDLTRGEVDRLCAFLSTLPYSD